MNTVILIVGITLLVGWLSIEITSRLLNYLRHCLEQLFIGFCSIFTAIALLAIIFSLGII